MIRKREPDSRLFYASNELYEPSQKNFYLRLDGVVGDWAELASPLRSCFCEEQNGRPVDPCVYLKIYLVGYFETITFDTDLAERVADSIAIRKFVGFGPTEKTPDHSSLSRVRSSYSKSGALEKVLEEVVKLCVARGLVGGTCASVDSSLLPANASLSSLKCVSTGVSVREHLQKLKETGLKPKVDNQGFRSSTDDEARIAKKDSAPKGMYYKLTHVTDEKSQVILAASAGCADVGDADSALAPIGAAKQTLAACGCSLETVVGDAGYDDSDFHHRLEEMELTPLTNFVTKSGGKAPEVRKDRFSYDAGGDLYICPNGASLKFSSKGEGRRHYVSRPEDCELCPLKDLCLSAGSTQRWISRHEHEESRSRNIARCKTEEGRDALKKRKTVVEPPFGHMKRSGGMHRLNCRGKERVQVKVLCAAIAWNLKKLVTADLLEPILRLLFTTLGQIRAKFVVPRSASVSSDPTGIVKPGFCDCL